MRETRVLMGMPITVEIADSPYATASGSKPLAAIQKVYEHFRRIDERFSPFKPTSEVSRLNAGSLRPEAASAELRDVLSRCAETKRLTGGFFDIVDPQGHVNPSGLVKGLAILQAAQLLDGLGYANYYVDAGGDLQVRGRNAMGRPWTVGIRNPFGGTGLVKVLELSDVGIATSGTYLRGQHIYDPRRPGEKITEIVSLTVIGPDVYEADRFATAAFAMGRAGLEFLAGLGGFEGYLIDAQGRATLTPGFNRYVKPN